jgi:putative membrane protein
MHIITSILIGIVAAQHLFFLYLEMIAWETMGPKVFRGFPRDLFPKTKSMAANQGLYNGFLAAGLIWSFFIQDEIWSKNVATFFLACVLIAGFTGHFQCQREYFLCRVSRH